MDTANTERILPRMPLETTIKVDRDLRDRINAAARLNGMSYSTFINGVQAAGIVVDRKILAELAVSDPAAFTLIAEKAQAALKSAA